MLRSFYRHAWCLCAGGAFGLLLAPSERVACVLFICAVFAQVVHVGVQRRWCMGRSFVCTQSVCGGHFPVDVATGCAGRVSLVSFWPVERRLASTAGALWALGFALASFQCFLGI